MVTRQKGEREKYQWWLIAVNKSWLNLKDVTHNIFAEVIYKCSNWAQKSLWEDREVVMNAVQQNGLVLTEADEDFIYDMEVLQTAVKQNWTLQLDLFICTDPFKLSFA